MHSGGSRSCRSGSSVIHCRNQQSGEVRTMKVERIASTFKPGDVRIGIVHLGLGAFVRAHLAVYMQKLLNQGEIGWGIAAANIRSNHELVDAMAAQGLRYTVAEYDSEARVTLREICSIAEVLYAGDGETEQLLQRIANPDTRILSLTVTEKGYCFDLANRTLNRDNPDIQHDIANPDRPRSAPGIIVAGLKHRYENAMVPFSVMSCDNMPHNGANTREVVIQLAACNSPGLAQWISETVNFPATMVDRIVPAATPASVERVQALSGSDSDRIPVSCEAFSQWVIEDKFDGDRPAFERADATVVDDVAPWEDMKLRMLNGSHSLLAYLGFLGGLEYVSDCMQQPEYVALIRHYMLNEAARTLNMPAGTDLAAYASQLILRFENNSLRHRTAQIAMDGSQKIPQRWLAGADILLARGELPQAVALGVAAWIRYVAGVDEGDNAIAVSDPLAETLKELAGGLQNPPETVDRFMDLPMFHQTRPGRHAAFKALVVRYLEALVDRGARQVVAAFPGQ